MGWRGVGVLLLLVVLMPFGLADNSTTNTTQVDKTTVIGSAALPAYTIDSAAGKFINLPAAAVYEIDADITVGPTEKPGTRQLDILQVFTNNKGCSFISGHGYVAHGNSGPVQTRISVQPTYCNPSNWPENAAKGGRQQGQTYHLNLVIDTIAGTQTYTIDGLGTKTVALGSDIVKAVSNGIRVGAGKGGKDTADEASAYGWTVKIDAVAKGAPGQAGSGGGVETGGTSGGSLIIRSGTGFEPNEEGDGEPTELLRKDGVFFIEPWSDQCPGPNGCEKVLRIPLDTNG